MNEGWVGMVYMRCRESGLVRLVLRAIGCGIRQIVQVVVHLGYSVVGLLGCSDRLADLPHIDQQSWVRYHHQVQRSSVLKSKIFIHTLIVTRGL